MKTPYDEELGKISDQDREYAKDMIDDLGFALDRQDMGVVEEWMRKHRYEAVMADRKSRLDK